MMQSMNFFQCGAAALAFLTSFITQLAQAESIYKYDISFIGSSDDRFKAPAVRNRMGNTILDDTNAAFWRVSEEAFIELGITNNKNKSRSIEEIGNEFSGASALFESIYNAVEDTGEPVCHCHGAIFPFRLILMIESHHYFQFIRLSGGSTFI